MSEQINSLPRMKREAELYEMDGVPIYGRPDDSGKTNKLDSIDPDESKIRHIADHLQSRGYGIVRERNPRSGKVFFTMKALWIGPGDPPDDPFSNV